MVNAQMNDFFIFKNGDTLKCNITSFEYVERGPLFNYETEKSESSIRLYDIKSCSWNDKIYENIFYHEPRKKKDEPYRSTDITPYIMLIQ
jgi:hypothetical protein